MRKINDILRVAENKVGKDTAKYLRELLATTSFRHTGIVNADSETIEWAAAQDTRSTCPLEECQNCIKWDDLAESIIIDGTRLMVVFTDGSANATNTDCLACGERAPSSTKARTKTWGVLSMANLRPATGQRYALY